MFIALLGAFSMVRAEAGSAAVAPRASLDYVLVVTGEELLRGAFADAHTAFITRTLHVLGGHCVGAMLVDDNAADIRDAVAHGMKKARLVIVTGGLGPTVNDVTRGALAELTAIRLAENPAALADLERRVQQSRDQLRPNLRRQALVPVRGTYLKNSEGTAVGLVFEPDGATIVALPGPPRELQPMVRQELVPFLKRKFGLRSPGSSLLLRFVGVGQSQIDQTLREHASVPADAVMGSVFDGSRVDFTFALPGDTAADRAQLAKIEASLRQHLGDSLYASDDTTLETHVVARLRARSQSLALVELGTGGRLAASLHGVAGIGEFLHAAYVAPSESRLRQTLDISDADWNSRKSAPDRITTLARAAQQHADADFVVAVGERSREENGKSSVLVAFGNAGDSLLIRSVPVQGNGELAHANLVTQVLDRLRRELK